jgi:hypothetical protein
MKKLLAFFNAPAKLLIIVSLIVVVTEFLIMSLMNSPYLEGRLSASGETLLDATLLIAIISPALYLLILRPMRRQQAELERQLDELCRFQKLTVGRELRMKELVEENAALRKQIAAAELESTRP